MGDVINLRQARKDRARKDKEQNAARNRATFGRSNEEKLRDATVSDLAGRRLEGHRRNHASLDDGDEDAPA